MIPQVPCMQPLPILKVGAIDARLTNVGQMRLMAQSLGVLARSAR